MPELLRSAVRRTVIQDDEGVVHIAILIHDDTMVSTLCDWYVALDMLSRVTDEPRVGRTWPVEQAEHEGIINCMGCIAYER